MTKRNVLSVIHSVIHCENNSIYSVKKYERGSNIAVEYSINCN